MDGGGLGFLPAFRAISRWPERRINEASSTADCVAPPMDSRFRGNDGFGGNDDLGAMASFPRMDADENYLAAHRARYPVETGFP